MENLEYARRSEEEEEEEEEGDRIYEFAVTAMALAYSPTFFRLRTEHRGETQEERHVWRSYSLEIDAALTNKCLLRRKAEWNKSPETLQKLPRASFYFRDFTLRYFRYWSTLSTPFGGFDWASCIVMLACKCIRGEFPFRQGNEISLTTAGRSTASVKYHNGCRLLPLCKWVFLCNDRYFAFFMHLLFLSSSFLLHRESEMLSSGARSLFRIYLS